MKKIKIWILFLCLGISSLFGASEIKELKFGILPTAGSSSLQNNWTPIIKKLENDLGIKVKLVFVSDYAGLITAMQYKHIDMAYFGPESYVQASIRANAKALVTQLNAQGLPGYRSIIITKKSSGITSIEQLKGKTWAFTDPNSTSGTLVPSLEFHKRNITPDNYFSKVLYSGSHEASILSVKAGRVDAASTNDLDFTIGEGRAYSKEDFNFIWQSDLIIGSPIAARNDLPDSLKDKIANFFINLKDPKLLEPIQSKGFQKAEDKDYDPIRALIEFKEKK